MKRIVQIFHNLIGKEAVSGMDADRGETASQMSAHEALTIAENSAEKGGIQDMSALSAVQVIDWKTFEKSVNKSLGEGQEQGCLLIADVDRFRNVNDIYGRDAGDAVLRYVVSVLRGVFGEGVCIGSPGGDIFTLWLSAVLRDSADEIRRRVGAVNDRLLHPTGELPPVSLSVGAAFYEPGDDCKSLGKKANKALYLVKESGRCGCEMSI